MNGLTKLVTIEHNDENSVILKVKKNKRLDLIKTGYFNGDEEMIRITKTKDCCGIINYTFFLNNGKHYGASENTLVSDDFKKTMNLVYETVHDDFGIHLRGEKIDITNYIKTIKDDKKVKHCFRLLGYNNSNSITVYKDNIWFKQFKNIEEAEHWIGSHYVVESTTDSKSIVDKNCNIRIVYTKKQ